VRTTRSEATLSTQVFSNGRISSKEISGFKISYFDQQSTYSITQRCLEDSEATMLPLPLGVQPPPREGAGVGSSSSLLNLLLEPEPDAGNNDWQQDVAEVMNLVPSRGYNSAEAASKNDTMMTTTANDLNTPVFEMSKPLWPTTSAEQSTSSYISPAAELATTSFDSINLGEGPGAVFSYTADSPSTFETVDPKAVSNYTAAEEPADSMFDELLSANFGIDTSEDTMQNLINNLEVDKLLDMYELSEFEEKPNTEDVTEMTLPVVNGTYVLNPGKIIASSGAERAPSMIHQPAPITVQIKPEDVPMPGVVSEPVFTFPDVFMLPTNKVEDNLIEPQQILMPTTVEESNNIILAEPTVVPNFNRPAKKERYLSGASSTSGIGASTSMDMDVDEIVSDTQLAPTILMVIEGRNKKTRGRPPVSTRKITKRVNAKVLRAARPITDDESATESNMSDVEYIAQMKYRRSRDLNNEASKRCREKRKEKFFELCQQRDGLADRNVELRAKLANMEKLVAELKKYFNENCVANNPLPTNSQWSNFGVAAKDFGATFFKQ